MAEKVIQKILKNKVFAVVRSDDHKKAIDISKALIDGGFTDIEITASCKNSCCAISEIASIEGINVAAGSIITNQQADLAVKAGAKLIVSPVLEMSLLKHCRESKIPIITGASTANEAYNAWKLGVSVTKIFPAAAMGGPEYIKDILKPMPFLNIMPTSGVQINDFVDYLKAGAVAVGMGHALYEDENSYAAITKNAQKVSKILKDYIDSQQQ